MAKQAPSNNRERRTTKARHRIPPDGANQSAAAQGPTLRDRLFAQLPVWRGMGSVLDLYGVSATTDQLFASEQPDYSGLFADYQALYQDALTVRARLQMDVERYAS